MLFWSAFLLLISPYSVRMRDNAGNIWITANTEIFYAAFFSLYICAGYCTFLEYIRILFICFFKMNSECNNIAYGKTKTFYNFAVFVVVIIIIIIITIIDERQIHTNLRAQNKWIVMSQEKYVNTRNFPRLRI